jgi:putative hydrolase of the HAD superfamily
VNYRAVIFDLGGVIVDSPMEGIARYEAELGLEPGFVNRLIVETGDAGAWTQLEQGKIDMGAFFDLFEADAAAAGVTFSARDLLARMGESSGVRSLMLDAVRRIRERGLAVAALTNNWKSEDGGVGPKGLGLDRHFDVFVESSVVGLSKPDPRIYEYACSKLGIEPREAVFLDDIGRNLKAARQLGMATIKVADPAQALDELEKVLGFGVRG